MSRHQDLRHQDLGSNFQMPLVFATLLLLAVEGIVMYAAFAYIEAYFTRWAFRSSMNAVA